MQRARAVRIRGGIFGEHEGGGPDQDRFSPVDLRIPEICVRNHMEADHKGLTCPLFQPEFTHLTISNLAVPEIPAGPEGSGQRFRFVSRGDQP